MCIFGVTARRMKDEQKVVSRETLSNYFMSIVICLSVFAKFEHTVDNNLIFIAGAGILAYFIDILIIFIGNSISGYLKNVSSTKK